jgi:hypothetical protein
MVFASNIFIFGFVPVFFSLYFLVPFRFKNALILIFSLLFYAYGAGPIVIVLVMSILVNYAGALLMARADGPAKYAIFVGLLALNIGALVYYKYLGFLLDIANDLTLGYLSSSGLERPNILLPIGISFFTFQALSYVADVYTGHCRPCRKLLDFGMYHSMFPQLIAGPIVRYTEVESQIRQRTVPADWVANGALPCRAGEEADHRRQRRNHRRRHFRSRPFAAHRTAGVVGRDRVRRADIVRLRRLLRYGHRDGQGDGIYLPGKLQPSLPIDQHHRVLVPLAHDAVAVLHVVRL